ncbi:nitroreductase [Nannocystis sp. ILAH1]|uniref:nitroreductase family protein n=1 Tax=unclassified Nannocystis TaxID=2627009 RepID=UPI00226FF342|nr:MULTISPECIES: nitroreductase [unclassified Nannocystis]MCY0993013.1 nitroreductase [Nannocystis sp. ILAH1]MCY1066153.1 nitroreductase [Nannocystis sp. RBIL2]
MTDAPLLDLMLARRSAPVLKEPGPTRAELARILGAAGTVPDHGSLRPFRFVVVEGEGRAAFGDALAETAAERRPGMPAAGLEKIRAKAFRSPTLIAVIASPRNDKIERWEQHATAACAGYAVVLAAHALGVGANWKSVPFTRGAALTRVLGLSADEEMFGWIHLGRASDEAAPAPRAPLVLADFASVLDGSGARRAFDEG